MRQKRGQVVSDGQGNLFAIDAVGEDLTRLHSVTTKESWSIPTDYAQLTLTVVEGVTER